MYLYTVTQDELYLPETGKYRTYGIRVEGAGGEEFLKVSDISTDRKMVEDLAKRCTDGQLAPAQLFEIIEDLL